MEPQVLQDTVVLNSAIKTIKLLMLKSHTALIMRSLSRRCVNRVFAPEGEILFSFPCSAWECRQESIQRKGGSIAASSCGASRGKREKSDVAALRQ